MLIIVIASISSVFTEGIKLNDHEGYKPKENSVLRIDLNGDIKERGVKNPFGDVDLGPFMPKASVGLNDIIDELKKAKEDKNIKGIYLEISEPVAGTKVP